MYILALTGAQTWCTLMYMGRTKRVRVLLRPTARRKWEKIRRDTRWGWAETAEALADAYLAQREARGRMDRRSD